MELLICQTMWGQTGSVADALRTAVEDGYGGIEGPPPESPGERRELGKRLRDAGLRFIGEIATGTVPGKYVPAPGAGVARHLEDFRVLRERCLELDPVWLTCMGGTDLWPLEETVAFHAQALELAAGAGVSFETHRGRSLFHPVATRRILESIPALQITADFSHWCVVCERLILDEQPALLDLLAGRVRHLHARVGYDQGAQVPDPRAPEFAAALTAHEGWWDAIWAAQERRGLALTTLTPEAGPDGYLQCAPFTRQPVADLREVNRWIAQRQRVRFSNR